MNRQEAREFLNAGHTLIKTLTPQEHGVSGDLTIWIRIEDICMFARRYRPDHEKYGPIHLCFHAGPQSWWIHITPNQLTEFLNRNYPSG